MRILFVGELEDHARSYQRFAAMRELGHEVTGVSTVPSGERPIGKGPLLPRAMGRLGLPLDRVGVNRRLRRRDSSATVDVIWVEKALMVRPSSLLRLKAVNSSAVLAFYSEDDMCAAHNQSRYFRQCVSLYDVVFTTKSYNCRAEELPALGARRVAFVDKAYDPHRHRPVVPTEAQIEALGSDVGFIGTYEDTRARKLLTLAQAGLNVRVWGNGWDEMTFGHASLHIERRPLFGDDYVASLCATKVNLCFLRKSNRDLQTDRTMEIPACGAFMLAERTDEHRRLFEEDKESVFFDICSDDELIGKTRYYLREDAERKAIAAAGRGRCVASDYSHHARLREMLKVCAHDA